MDDPYEFVASLRVWHPTLLVDDISSSLGHKPTVSWNCGDDAILASGTLLGRKRDETYWSAQLLQCRQSSQDQSLQTFLAKLADHLTTHDGFFKSLRITGGRADVFVGLYNRGNTELPLSSELMGSLAALGLELLIDMYIDVLRGEA